MPLERPKARYQQIAQQLREAIERGEYPAGSDFPAELDLTQTYGVARTTVNKALVLLRSEGLIRVTGGRTIVRELKVMTRDAASRFRLRAEGGGRGAFDAEVRRQGKEPRSDVTVAEQPAPDDIAALLGIEPGTKAVSRDRLMFADSIPLQLAVSWIPLDIAAGTPLTGTDTGPGGTYDRLADLGHAPATYTETVTLRLPSDEERDWLRLDAEQRVYFIRREARDADGRCVEVCDTVTPAHQWRLVYTWPADAR